MKALLIGFVAVQVAWADIFINQDSSTSNVEDYKEGASYKKYDVVKSSVKVKDKTYTMLWKLYGASKKFGGSNLGQPGKSDAWKLLAIIGEKADFSIKVKKENIYEFKEGFSYSHGHVISHANKLWRLNCQTKINGDKPETLCAWNLLGVIAKGSDTTQKNSDKSVKKSKSIHKK